MAISPTPFVGPSTHLVPSSPLPPRRLARFSLLLRACDSTTRYELVTTLHAHAVGRALHAHVPPPTALQGEWVQPLALVVGFRCEPPRRAIAASHTHPAQLRAVATSTSSLACVVGCREGRELVLSRRKRP